jgi:general stress protein YciG
MRGRYLRLPQVRRREGREVGWRGCREADTAVPPSVEIGRMGGEEGGGEENEEGEDRKEDDGRKRGKGSQRREEEETDRAMEPRAWRVGRSKVST